MICVIAVTKGRANLAANKERGQEMASVADAAQVEP